LIIITNAALYPLSFENSLPAPGPAEYLADPFVRHLLNFFQSKGLAALVLEDQREQWYQDWIDFQAQHGLYAGLLSPKAYSSRGTQLDLLRLTRFIEAFAYFGPAHAYSLQVSFLGLFPIFMSANEPLKREAIAKLKNGGLFAFGVSERNHGSDLLANEFTLKSTSTGAFLAEGSKCYIGNANAACLISVLAKKIPEGSSTVTKRTPFAFFALRPAEAPAFQNLKKIRTLGIRSAFVGEFDVKGHVLPATDVISEGRQAWEAAFGTVNLGKFFLGFGAIGICERAFGEAVGYMQRRILYGKPITALPHIRATTTAVFARLAAMKLFAYRALDYLQAACADDRRYLLFNAVQKARVSTEGARVIQLLSECVGARGFEADTYLESALRQASMIPMLEGSAHINFGLTAQFIDSYFAPAGREVSFPGSVALHQVSADENPYWFEAADRNAKTVMFSDCLRAYEPLKSAPNVQSFIGQVEAFRAFIHGGESAPKPAADASLLIALGKCFSTIAYGQLVAENCALAGAPLATVSVIFHGLIEDLSVEALHLSAHFEPDSAERTLLHLIVRTPRTTAADFEVVFTAIAAQYAA
jgi:acyl-CoA dehydrogenase